MIDTARHEVKIDVRGQMSVTGVDTIAPASWLNYNLATLRQPMRQMAQATANMLVSLIASGSDCAERRVTFRQCHRKGPAC